MATVYVYAVTLRLELQMYKPIDHAIAGEVVQRLIAECDPSEVVPMVEQVILLRTTDDD